MTRRSILFSLAVVLLFSGNSGFSFGQAQDCGRWEDRTSGPSAAAGQVMVFDSHRKKVVLYGLGNGTWEYDGKAWRKGSPLQFEPIGTALAYDSDRLLVVAFGGYDGMNDGFVYSGATWEWNGSSWTMRDAGYGDDDPPPRMSHAMAYDSQRHITLLFGGEQTGGSFAPNDTWGWDGTDWTRLGLGGPPPRDRHSMVFDSYTAPAKR